MKIRVLGCSGAIAAECRTTSFLVDDDLLVDAGTGVGDLSLQEMSRITDVLLTHAHLDHVCALPLMVDAVGSRLRAPLRVHALGATIDALRAHIFNGVIWPDFSCLPQRDRPFLSFHEIDVGQALAIGTHRIEVLPAVHTVPAVGFAVAAPVGPWWVFSGDTGPNPLLWQRVNQIDVGALVIETAFSEREKDLAERSCHLSPRTLAGELRALSDERPFPIYITHTKPAETEAILAEIRAFHPPRDIRWLQAGQELDL
ncbi:3',5'-cyclic-nucleotide phosphodiesterase [Ramlibacter sp. AW1]|uniref:3',5'-cyclic-nucleotide phosphodiesterase n=1 Tax=Ramlibacter aurantiacus TaxID=2801330 RepID=A0A936ZP72_9BURK|nr:3',5'-cyclic-nucleotide phosphodiesterase [Ramlibacter aurantiacus]MBL0421216.1 3',5'-cyclic-nucleotide phosphodiesterase [Ramlibacter aurantiacus]